MIPITVTELNIYPVKSIAGISLTDSQLGVTGLQYDRRWMVVDRDGRFMSQRQHAQMAIIRPHLDQGALVLSAPGADDHPVSDIPRSNQSLNVQIWDATVDAIWVSRATDEWLSQVLGMDCRLVYFPESTIRQVDLNYANSGDQTAFSDGFPLLVISEGSLTELNRRLEQPVTMKRFRPNIVVSGCGPFAEDNWKRIQIGDVNMRVVKPCSRCVITTIDPDSGIRSGPEPLKTLFDFRAEGKKVMFGQNVIHDHEGYLKLGDPVEVLE